MFFKRIHYRTASVTMQTFKEKKLHSKRTFTNIVDDFLQFCTIHGIGRIFRRSSPKIDRFLWAFGLISATIIFSYVTWRIGLIYRYKPLKTVISDLKLPVFKIPFPEVTICNRNRLNWQRFEEAKSTFLNPQHRSPQYESVFLEAVNAYDTLQFAKFGNFKNLSNMYPFKLLQDLNYINFTKVTQLMAWKCHEVFAECSWINRTYDCCEIFSARKSQLGPCLSFNSIETEEGLRMLASDPYYPWRSSGIGPKSGLKLRIHTRESFQSPLSQGPKGAIVMLVEPHVWAYLPHDVPTNTRAMVSISAFMHYFDEYTRIFPADTRQCVFEDELESFFYKSLQNHKYMYENCQAECQQEYLMKFCNCTIDLFYPPGPYRACELQDLPCLYKHNEALKNFEQVGEQDFVAYHEGGMNCPCLYNCKSLSYSINVHIDHGRKSEPPLNPNSTEIEMAVFFLWGTIKVYKTTAVYTILDLMASLGGLAGLCIGCSLMGIIELLYFSFINVSKEGISSCKNHVSLNPKRKSLRARKIVVQPRKSP